MSQDRRSRLLKRDQNKCGIHFFGCGRELTHKQSNVGHIYPKMAMKNQNSFDFLSREQRKKIKTTPGFEMTGKAIPSELNVQPMCKACNDQMKARFPPHPVIKSKCNCCDWVYVVCPQQGGVYPILPTSFLSDQTGLHNLRIPGKIVLLRCMGLSDGSMGYFGYPLGDMMMRLENADGLYLGPYLVTMFSNNKEQRKETYQAGEDRGSIIPIVAMVENNLRHPPDVLEQVSQIPCLAAT